MFTVQCESHEWHLQIKTLTVNKLLTDQYCMYNNVYNKLAA